MNGFVVGTIGGELFNLTVYVIVNFFGHQSLNDQPDKEHSQEPVPGDDNLDWSRQSIQYGSLRDQPEEVRES